MTLDLDHIEQAAKAAQERSPGPWRRINIGAGEQAAGVIGPDKEFDYIIDSAPRPVEIGDDEFWPGNRVVETDGGYYEPKGATGEFIATCSPDVVLALVARVRELEKRCHIVESHPPDYAIESLDADTQIFILKERLLDERHKTYQLECEVKELEEEIESHNMADEEASEHE
jgi:hypothetical protein